MVGSVMQFLVPLVLLLFLNGCASKTLDAARDNYFIGQHSEAVAILEDCNEVSRKNVLLCYFEKGSMLYYHDEYQRSSNSLLAAADLIEEQDRISIVDQTTAIVVSDQTTEYKGEYSERLWVHTLQMMNFLLQNDFQSAQVEAKQAIEIFDEFSEALQQDYFTRALVALSFENMGNANSARIEYNKLQEEIGDGFIFPSVPRANEFEAILFISQSRIPVKISKDIVVPPSVRVSLPEYSNYDPPQELVIEANGKSVPLFQLTTDLGNVAKLSLKQRVTEIVARQAARAVTKEALAQAVGGHDDLTEALVRLVLFVAEQADTRSWQTLPAGLTLVRVPMAEGSNRIDIYNDYGTLLTQLSVEGKRGTRQYFSVNF